LIAVRPFNIDVTASFRRSTWWQYYTIILQQVAKGCLDPRFFLKQMILLKHLISHLQGLRFTVVIVTGLVSHQIVVVDVVEDAFAAADLSEAGQPVVNVIKLFFSVVATGI
jgi:hypothetical protein